MNVLKALQLGFAVLAALASVEAGQSSPPFRVGSQWFSITEVPAPK